MGCYLYCCGYQPETIAASLQVDLPIVEKWIIEARDGFEVIQPIMILNFDLSAEMIARLVDTVVEE